MLVHERDVEERETGHGHRVRLDQFREPLLLRALQTVAVGIQTATDAEILSGLKESELVIFGAQGQYRTGEVVAPKVVNPSEME